MVEFKEILEFLVYILKMIIYFDTERIKYHQFGGEKLPAGMPAPPPGGMPPPPEGMPPPPEGIPPPPEGKPKPKPSSGKPKPKKEPKESTTNLAPEDDEEKDGTDEAAEDAGSAGLLWIFTFVKDIVMGVIKWFGDKATKLAGILLFASVAPIIPFFVSMAGLFGVMKYMMFKLRRL